MKNMKVNEGQRGAGQLLSETSLVDGISISNHMAKHRYAVSVLYRIQNATTACNAGGSSSLHKRMNAAAAAMRNNVTQNQPPIPAARVIHTAHASTSTASAAHSTPREPLQQHLHFLHATPRHTLHDPRSPAPRRPVHHVHTGRRGGQTTACDRHAAAHDAH